MGKRVVLVGAQTLEPDCTHWVGIRKGMEARGIDYHEIDWRANPAEKVLEQINALDADLLIWGLIDPFETGIPNLARAKKRALWFAEIRDQRTGGYPNWDMRSQVDFVLLSNDGLLDFYTKHTKVPTYFVAQGGFEGQVAHSYDYDVVFIGGKLKGGLFGRRLELIESLKNEVTHINEEALEDRMRVYREMPSIYATSKICFDASHVWDVSKYCSGRFFHIACNGGFSVCRRFPGCEEFFPEGVGKVYFETPKEADTLIDYYLDHPEERKEIAARGKAHALAHHTYANRVDDICALI